MTASPLKNTFQPCSSVQPICSLGPFGRNVTYSSNADSTSLPAYIPFKKTQAFVKKINERRMKAESAIIPISLTLRSEQSENEAVQ